jgi:5-methylcytosine-specific restriction enzyme subunit McrC
VKGLDKLTVGYGCLSFKSFLFHTKRLRQLDLFAPASFDSESLSFQDLLIYQLAAEASELLLRGLHRKYVRREETLSSPRGRIDIQKIARQGGIAQASLPCVYYPRLEDCLINQVLLQGLRLAVGLTNDSRLRTHLFQLADFHLSNISSIRVDQHILKRLHREMDRLVSAYMPSITLIEMLLLGEGMSLDESQAELSLPGFLFDMNLFFQELLSRFLSEYLQDYTVETQFELEDMMVYIENPRKREAPRPRPDFVIKQGGKIVAILDAKYRDLWENPLPPHMLYQLVIYALSQEPCNNAVILYPTTQSDAREATIKVRLEAHSQGYVYVILRPVNLLKLEEVITKPGNAYNERERIAFAQILAFGHD